MKTRVEIILKWLIPFVLISLISGVQVYADSISSINGAKSIAKGKKVTVHVDYQTHDKDLLVMLQKLGSPWTNYYIKRIPSKQNGKTVTFTVPETIPEGTPLMYQAYLTQKGKGWTDKVAVKWQKNVKLIHAKQDKITSINGPIVIEKGEVIKVVLDYQTEDKDLFFMLQGSKKPWKHYYYKKISSDKNVKNITFSVPETIPEGTPLMYQVYLTPKGKGWADKVAVKWQSGVILKPTITDNTPPIITLNGANPLTIKVGSTYREAGATARDNVDGDISSNIVIGEAVDTNIEGTYDVIYSVRDTAGNEASITRSIIVSSNIIKPVIEYPWDHGALKVSDDKHMLQHADGTGFFWMADTAWHLTVKANRDDTESYMTDRKAKGFSVIQVSALPTKYNNGQFAMNYYGDFPFSKNATTPPNFDQPNEAYWQHIDYIIETAKENKIYVALLPTWNGVISNTNEASKYGEWIAKRYQNKKNIIWINGGDSNPDNGMHTNKSIWNSLGKAIDSTVANRHLITYHPGGGSSSNQWFNDAAWLDFHMAQSGHCDSMINANKLIINNYNKSRPIIDGEPRYETIEECFYKNPRGTRFNDKNVREIAYRQLFSGAFGHTYGHHSVWQISPKKNDAEGVPGIYSTTKSWLDALNDLGAQQMTYVTKLMKSRPILNRVPDQSLIKSGKAISTKGNGYAMVYLSDGGSVTVNLKKIASNVKAWWYDPRTGEATEIGTYGSNTQTFDTSDTQDMVLVLDDTSKGFGTPGVSNITDKEDNTKKKHFAFGYLSLWRMTPEDIRNVDPLYTHVVLSFAKPDLSFDSAIGVTREGTGLAFLPNQLDKYKEAFASLQDRGVKVLLGVGGGSYSTKQWDTIADEYDKPIENTRYKKSLKNLITYLNLDGIDIDYERVLELPVEQELINQYYQVILALKDVVSTKKLLTMTGGAAGAECSQDMVDNQVLGCNKKSLFGYKIGLERKVFDKLIKDGYKIENLIDYMTIMTYNTLSKDSSIGTGMFDPVLIYKNHKEMYKGPLAIGFAPVGENYGDGEMVATNAQAKECLVTSMIDAYTPDRAGTKKPYSLERIIGFLKTEENSGIMVWNLSGHIEKPTPFRCSHAVKLDGFNKYVKNSGLLR